MMVGVVGELEYRCSISGCTTLLTEAHWAATLMDGSGSTGTWEILIKLVPQGFSTYFKEVSTAIWRTSHMVGFDPNVM